MKRKKERASSPALPASIVELPSSHPQRGPPAARPSRPKPRPPTHKAPPHNTDPSPASRAWPHCHAHTLSVCLCAPAPPQQQRRTPRVVPWFVFENPLILVAHPKAHCIPQAPAPNPTPHRHRGPSGPVTTVRPGPGCIFAHRKKGEKKAKAFVRGRRPGYPSPLPPHTTRLFLSCMQSLLDRAIDSESS